MTIAELEGRNVKLGAHTITIKDDEGKTRGLVRISSRYWDLPLHDQIDLSKTLRSSGLLGLGAKVYASVFVDNKKMYWFCDQEDDELIQMAQAADVNVIKVAKVL